MTKPLELAQLPSFIEANTTSLVVNATSYAIGSSFVANTTGVYHTGTVNASSITTTGLVANVTGVYPTSNTSGTDLGVSNRRWVVNANTINASGLVTALAGANVVGTIDLDDVNISGNLTVSGTTTYINTTTLNVGDNIVSLNADLGALVAPTENAGLEINRGSAANVSFSWNETTDSWTSGNTDITGYANASVSVNSALLTVGTSFIANTTGAYHTGTVNAASFTVGSSLIANSTALTTASNTATIGTAAYVVANGNVGIGTASPATKLDVSGQITTRGSTGALIAESRDGSGAAWSLYNPTGDDLRIFGNSLDRLVLDNSGNMGLGIASPTDRLDIRFASGTGNLKAGISAGNNIKLFNTAGDLSITSSDSASDVILDSQRSVMFKTANTERMRVNAGAPILCLSGGSTTATGTGIAFPATQSASTDANTLDDYEEGTYTPTVVVNSGTPAYSYQQGYYTKIGRQVFGGGIIGITNSNTLTGTLRVTLPFTVAAGSFGYTGGFTSDGSGFTWPVSQGGASFYSVYLQANPGDAHLNYTGIGSTAAAVSYTSSGVGASWYFRFSFSFYV